MKSAGREQFWADLRHIKTSEPWIIMGDLNCVRRVDEKTGAPVRSLEMEAINRCMLDCGLDDVRYTWCLFTWNNKQKVNARVYSKLGRIMANDSWVELYENAEGCFMQEEDFDHSPSLLTIYPRLNEGKKPFKYYTMWRLSFEFITRVSR